MEVPKRRVRFRTEPEEVRYENGSLGFTLDVSLHIQLSLHVLGFGGSPWLHTTKVLNDNTPSGLSDAQETELTNMLGLRTPAWFW